MAVAAANGVGTNHTTMAVAAANGVDTVAAAGVDSVPAKTGTGGVHAATSVVAVDRSPPAMIMRAATTTDVGMTVAAGAAMAEDMTTEAMASVAAVAVAVVTNPPGMAGTVGADSMPAQLEATLAAIPEVPNAVCPSASVTDTAAVVSPFATSIAKTVSMSPGTAVAAGATAVSSSVVSDMVAVAGPKSARPGTCVAEGATPVVGSVVANVADSAVPMAPMVQNTTSVVKGTTATKGTKTTATKVTPELGLRGNLRDVARAFLLLERFLLVRLDFGLGRLGLDETFDGSILKELGRHLRVVLWKKVIGGSRKRNEESDSDERPRFHGIG